MNGLHRLWYTMSVLVGLTITESAMMYWDANPGANSWMAHTSALLVCLVILGFALWNRDIKESAATERMKNSEKIKSDSEDRRWEIELARDERRERTEDAKQ